MFSRLGTHHSDIFGVMDLTAGYHQAPVGLMTRIFLAFICFCGIYQYCRLSFGPKRAPSYFQQMMSSVVLIGLLYFICEMYLDDCIVHAKGEDQFIERLDKVLTRFKEHNITLKPSKCKFGMSNVEYCGKEISKEGLTMSMKKVQSVLNFPMPTTAGEMKQFVGLVNYFHDYVEHHSDIMHPLHQMIQDYQKKTKSRLLVWNEEGTAAFHKIIAEISKRHTTFFRETTALSSYRPTLLIMVLELTASNLSTMLNSLLPSSVSLSLRLSSSGLSSRKKPMLSFMPLRISSPYLEIATSPFRRIIGIFYLSKRILIL